ncbi:hypothetical protein FRB91_009539 [Serendipita sp. 411]|nr:hypothetical protein FRB91_009539 [Serendipita sp. 411]
MASYRITRADKVIVVMGPTGAGKSTFIDYAMGGSGQGIGHNLRFQAQDITVRKISIGTAPQSFAFVDTPGLDDTHKQDYDTLQKIAEFLIKAHKDGLQTDKLLYLHRISDNRLTVSPLKSLELLSSLCDNIEIPPVTIVTTMWSLVAKERGRLQATELHRTLQSKMKNGGWQILEFNDTMESARAIVQAEREGSNTRSQGHASNNESLSANITLGKQPEKPMKTKGSKLKSQQGNPAAGRLPSSEMVGYGIDRTEKIIIVMGPTGVGKSTFIDYAAGGNGQGIGHSLKSCTQDIVVRKTTAEGQSFALVDTPGLNNTTRSNYEILGEIASFLVKTRMGRYQLDKILYLHQISDNRMAGTSSRDLELFATLCGNAAMPNIIVVTTMWSLVANNTGKEREEQLREAFWSQMITGGCRIARFEDSTESARGILLEEIDGLNTTLLAQELVDKSKNLDTTAAGILLSKQLERLLQEEKESSRKLEQLSRNNSIKGQHLQFELNAIRGSILQKVSELGKFNRSFLDIILRWFSKLAPTVPAYSAQGDEITQGDKIVIVIGLPGAGKSTFVDYATGGNGEGIGHSVVVGTKSITICKTIVEGQSFAFVDTPGLDDVNKVSYGLEDVATFLVKRLNHGHQLDRILYMHRISDNRLTASPLEVLERFAVLCGNSAMPNVTIVTTMWSLVKDNIGDKREEDLRKILKSMTTTVQCRIARFGDSKTSAHGIILEQ